jgi:hypothetical protein
MGATWPRQRGVQRRELRRFAPSRLADSPIGLAVWMLDHDDRSTALIARVFDGQIEGLTRGRAVPLTPGGQPGGPLGKRLPQASNA